MSPVPSCVFLGAVILALGYELLSAGLNVAAAEADSGKTEGNPESESAG